MRRILIFAMLLAGVGNAICQETEDSVASKELKEVVVEAPLNQTSAIATVYTPTRQQKNASRDAIDLLRKMGIPQINVSPIDNSISDNAGQPVALFINFMPASQEELAGMRMSDVKTVNYMEYPADPRFQGKPRVINYILHEYLYGGYTKTSVSEYVLTGLNSNVGIFSKFSFKKMIFDVYAGLNNSDTHHGGSESKTIFSLLDNEKKPYDVIRQMTTTNYHKSNYNVPLTFRAQYSAPKMQIRNTIGYNFQNNKKGLNEGDLSFSEPGFSNLHYTSDYSGPTNNLSYNGYFFFILPRDWSFMITPQLTYSHSNNRSFYSTDAPFNILRHTREDAYYYRFDASLSRRVNQKHTFALNVTQGMIANNLKYMGTDNYDERMRTLFMIGTLTYTYSTPMLSLYGDIAFVTEINKINGNRQIDPYPGIHINANYSPNSKNTFGMYFQFASTSADLSERTPDILQSNELLYITGNENLKNSRHITLNLSYLWMPKNNFNIDVYATFYDQLKLFTTIYEHYLDGSAILRRYVNGGDHIRGNLGCRINWTPIPGTLQFYGGPLLSIYRTTGINKCSCTPLNFSMSAIYYFGNFYLQAYYSTRDKSMAEYSPTITTTRNYYYLSGGWGNNDWNIAVHAFNIFNKGWRTSRQALSTDLYSSTTTNYGKSYHPMLGVTASYTFGYGKRIQRGGDEVGGQSGASSAILK